MPHVTRTTPSTTSSGRSVVAASIATAAALLLGACASAPSKPAGAEPSAASAPAQPVPTAAVAAPGEMSDAELRKAATEKVCREVRPTGSRVARRVCRTIDEDRRERERANALLDSSVQADVSANTGGT